MAKNLKISGNFLIVSDTITRNDDFRLPRSNARYLYREEGSDKYFKFLPIAYMQDLIFPDSKNDVLFTDIIDDRTGLAFTSTDELKEFLDLNLGGTNNPIQVLKYTGWVFYADSQYTSLSPLTINNSRTQVTIDGLGAETNITQQPADAVDPLWDKINNKIVPIALNDAYSLRFSFVAEMVKNSYFSIQLDIGEDSIITISAESKVSPNTTNDPTRYSFDVPIFCLQTFIDNGGKIYIDNTDDGSTMDAYNFEILLVRLHKAN